VAEASSYGTAGGKGQFSRFQVEGGPTAGIFITVGGVSSGLHPHLIGTTGAAYSWGETIGDGLINLIPDGNRVTTFGYNSVANGQSIPLGGFYNQLDSNVNQRVMNILSENISRYFIFSNGEFVWTATDGTNYGAKGEAFTTAGTVQVNNGSTAVTGVGTNFTGAALPGYAYTPSLNVPRTGDILALGAAGSRNYYRISDITSATTLTIFPANAQVNFGPSANYQILRTGYGSISKVIRIPNPTTGDSYCYYAGNMKRLVDKPGTIECVVISGASYTVSSHFTCPQNTGGTDVLANDVAYYKNFLLYGASSAIGWSVAGFPTSFTTGFGTTDFPANNITVVDNTDTFVGFEYIGDQLVALFRDSVWIIQATGSVPEFEFHRMPEILGAVTQGQADGQAAATYSYCRASTSARGRCFYVSRNGVMELSSGTAVSISEGVNSAGLSGFQPTLSCLSWDKYSDTLLWYAGGNGGDGRVMAYRVPYHDWFQLRLGSAMRAMAGGITPAAGYYNDPIRHFGVGWWDSANAIMYTGTSSSDIGKSWDRVQAAAPPQDWSWSSPVIDLGAVYPGFQFGGFTVESFGRLASAPTLTWTIYGGASPYNLFSRDTGTLSYSRGHRARNKMSGKLDDRFIAVKLNGSSWIDLSGVFIYDASTDKARR